MACYACRRTEAAPGSRRTFNPAHYVYQCMTILPDGTLGLLWEREMQGQYFTRIPLEWVEAAKI